MLTALLAGTQRTSPRRQLEVLLVGDRKSWNKGSGGVRKVNPLVSNFVIQVCWWFHCMKQDGKEDWQIWVVAEVDMLTLVLLI